MQLSLKEMAEIFGVDDDTIYEWIADRSFPHSCVDNSYRFNRIDVLEWANRNHMNLSPAFFQAQEDEGLPALSEAIRLGGVVRDVEGVSKREVFAKIVGRMALPEDMEPEFVVEVLLAREEQGSTGIGEGIAIPHPRTPLVIHGQPSRVAVAFLRKPLDFGAIDGAPVSTIFTIMTPTIKAHLYILSRLAMAVRNPQWHAALQRAAPAEELLAVLEKVERAWAGGE
jgi:PTS system nitrogen regulatory IIA component